MEWDLAGKQIADSIIALYQYMSEILSKAETRGRPKKKSDEKLPPISRELFSEHCAVFYACCMVYVLEVFLKTKQEKRIGHSEGGFIIYQKVSDVYTFDTFNQDIRDWGFDKVLLENKQLSDFIRTANGCAPKFVFRELVALFVHIHKIFKQEKVSTFKQLEICQEKLFNQSQAQLNKNFKYIRFTGPALKELKMEKFTGEVTKKMRQLWRPFIKIISYTIYCVENKIPQNKYHRPFFSDAQHPEETIIGQLNLEQIVEDQEEKVPGSSSHMGFIKITKVKEEEDLHESDRGYSGEQAGSSVFDRTPQSNRRPITLITFPSNARIQAVSPSKQAENQKKDQLEDQQAASEHSYPSKKVKLE